MNESLHQAVCDALDYLVALQDQGVRPPEARARLQALRGRHPALRVDLLTEEESFDRSIHYDALLRRAGEGTVSVSYCPERTVPWPLRGVHRWSESDLVRVNDNVLEVEAAMACLDFIWDEAPILERLVDMCIIQEELERQPIELTDAELQEAMDKFRSAKKLFKAEDTRQWLDRHGMTHEKLERYVTESAIVPKLRDRIVGSRVDEYFREHRADFDLARLARIEVASAAQAHELAGQIGTDAQKFFATAERIFFERAERGTPPKASVFATIDRRQAEPAFRERIFAAAPGQLIELPTEAGYELIRVLAIIPAKLDDRTRGVIKDILFKQWLTEQRQAARIEWCWGTANTTAART